jgi:pyruvate dehydrogenase E2 component (dihydrolipoamide acetyltransferase)/2-oxoisovalerate dehydrogenase E2 component (dihydrolipoyl transacylase)
MDFPLPQLGEGVYEAELIRWIVKAGDSVKRGQNLLEVMTDKATMEVPAPFSGTIQSLAFEAGRKIKVGEVILSYVPTGSDPGILPATKRAESTPTTVSAPAPASVNGSAQSSLAPVLSTPVAAPSVRHLARKMGIDLHKVSGSGPGGRVLIDDLTAFVRRSSDPEKVIKPKEPLISSDFGKPGTKVHLQGMRRKIAEHLVEAKRRIPHYSYIDECNITDLVRLRHSLREACAARALKITYLAFFIKAVTAALREIPIVNSSLNDATEEIILHDHYHIGIAVATPNGLIVPVIKNADKKDIFTIAAEVDRLGSDAKSGRVKLEDLRGGTFTVTSIGNIGGLISTPIINHPEVGIMGVGKVVKRPVYDDAGNLKPADLIYLSFSFDHRVVDGAVGAAFGNAVVKQLQNPAVMLIPEQMR